MTATLRQTAPTTASRILGVGGLRGEDVVPNDEIVGPINSSDEWIRQRTGIVSRRRAKPTTTLADLAEGAARAALDAAGIDASQVDAVLVSTVTYFEQTPSIAAVLTDRLGATPAAAYDISAACAGYCYGIAQADAMVRSGVARHVLVVGVEKMSDFIDPTDRTISFLLGDGAGAAVVGPSDVPGIGPTVWGSDGAQSRVIFQTEPWLAFRRAAGEGVPAGLEGVSWPTLRQEGPTVFKWVISQMPDVARRAVAAAGLEMGDIDVFIPHQANMRITDQLVKLLKLGPEVAVGRDIAETGNTSAASVPLATERLLREGAAKSGDVALQIGFGAGLVYAAQVVVLP
ncbi:3-oxoacyl-(acyl-carrier-protein) synthase III [Beutenbergia cavernae DSM 12333]|uniref:3-oxoacyl-(Acyl-carrier-protein) synthase III n=1 Tax=Beutenbergia cavernae (strain ATCC BAA-8 / DSM 12333 / CCUG 43141 / JCM 11478 / NBRC 16432 / NCIMB 13614 / HKI 0122) TaxID=471853 RepID=C5C4T4_BEUC1|nr:beta-ketoacyl-ACP synthase III [Beutenbergia cavernae]ACQ80062.1 3-oxoacyl-(acyl-carrier-protein) synthase III [Beutenbergia cavernae DSM 12333]